MPRAGGVAGCAAAFALTAGLAFDAGGFHPPAWNRAFVALAAAALLLVLLVPVERPGRFATATIAALGLLTAWTAASWFWSDSPALAPLEAQRVALYLMAAVVTVLAGRRIPLASVSAGILAAATAAGAWNLAIRLAPDWTGRAAVRTDIGQLADPIGYANGLALLAVAGLLLALELPRAAPLLVPLAGALALQDSAGALAALAAGVVVYAWASQRLLRTVALLVVPAVAAVLVAGTRSVVAPSPTDLLAAAGPGHRLLVLLAVLTAVQAVLVRVRVPAGPRVPAAVALLLVVAGLAAAPLLLHGHSRADYWRVAAGEARANPVLGSGAGTFVDWWVRLRPTPQSTHEAHSLYLETVAELGPIGLALVLAALAIPLAAAWRLRAPAVLAVLVAYAVGAAVDFHWELTAVTAPVILLGAAAAVRGDGPRRAFIRRAYAVPALALLTAAGVLALAGNAAIQAGDARRAIRFAPYSAEAWKLRGDRRGYERAVELDPADWSAWRLLGELSTGKARASALAEARRLNPLGGIP
jgi:O-antigen ligase